MSPDSVNANFQQFMEAIGAILTYGVPVILTITASLIGLSIIMYYVHKWIGGDNLENSHGSSNSTLRRNLKYNPEMFPTRQAGDPFRID